MAQRTALIIGAGPAGLTAAFELLDRTDVVPTVLERDDCMGGIARTVQYKGNRMDIGGHRFFSKSDRVMNWWFRFLPPESSDSQSLITYQRSSRKIPVGITTPEKADCVMMLRPRKSRIFFLRRLFDYPLSLSLDLMRNLGFLRMVRIGLSYAKSMVFRIPNESNLEQFFINRFGHELYQLFFRSYTEKVWGRQCREISAEWGHQRVKGLSILKVMAHGASKLFRGNEHIAQKGVETSLIEQFLYPKFGPGQMWDEVARNVQEKGGRIIRHQQVEKIVWEGARVKSVVAVDQRTGEKSEYSADFVFSTMAIQDLVVAADPTPPEPVPEIARGLIYRDFITVGVLVSKLKIRDQHPHAGQLLRDNWIYIQEPDVQLGRLQIFNNWSSFLVANPATVWLGLEYFCFETDAIWHLPDAEMIQLAVGELAKLDIIEKTDFLDATVVRMPKAYPAYFGSYDRFGELRPWLDSLENLLLVGRNGMHRYNNQDHSMLTSMIAVDNILAGVSDRSNLWDVNLEQDYHEGD
jgi:protoporphyrinogen oxidase